MIKKGHRIGGACALILGMTFKENCPDIRNSRVIDIYKELVQFGLNVEVHDPHAIEREVEKEFNINLVKELTRKYDVIVLAVAHEEFKHLDYQLLKQDPSSVIFDIKGLLEKDIVDARL